MKSPMTPAEAWSALREGNDRFVAGTMDHPAQGVDRRMEVSHEQHPFAVMFGCSDSRVASELIFDRGLGDMFVVRNAGHVIDTTALGSIEFGVEILGAPLIVVLGHVSCGAVAAARAALVDGTTAPGMISAVVDMVIPSIVGSTPNHGTALELPDAAALGREHVRRTVSMLSRYSKTLEQAVAEGRCAIVGAEYALSDGQVSVISSVGDIE